MKNHKVLLYSTRYTLRRTAAVLLFPIPLLESTTMALVLFSHPLIATERTQGDLVRLLLGR